MYIKQITISNFRIFNNTNPFSISGFNVPDGSNSGSGLNVFVGENGCGKTSLLDALTLPILGYKAESISLDDFNDLESDIKIVILADKAFNYDGTMPKIKYKGKGFEFEAGIRTRENRAYLSSVVVRDQRFVRADGETRPEDGKPDLRLKVDNPWKGARFSENDILYLEKNRVYQTRSGTYNTTRFDRLMEDYNYKHLKENSPVGDIDADLAKKILSFENTFLNQALEKFEEISGEPINLNLINNYAPFKNAFFGVKRDNNHQVGINAIGSGYEMIFTLLYSYYLAQQSGKQLILLIDEPDLHLHPGIQDSFASLLLEFSKDSQIFVTTHSPLLVKQLEGNDLTMIKILLNEHDEIKESDPQESKLSYVSANEINYIAFQLPTEEYHNELYEELFDKHATRIGIRDFDQDFFQGIKRETPNHAWKSSPNQVTLHTYVRNQIHHRASCGAVSKGDLMTSIETMRAYL